MAVLGIRSIGRPATSSQQVAAYYARKRRKAREHASAAEFRVKGVGAGVRMTVTVTTV